MTSVAALARAVPTLAAICVAGVLDVGEARADTLTIASDTSNYTMGTSQSGNTGGGEFAVTSIQNLVTFQGSAPAIQGSVFQTFTLERNESISDGTYDWTLSHYAHSGGVGGAVDGADKLSAATATLFLRFNQGTLTNYGGHSYDYTAGSGRVASAAELQDAIWYLEGELSDSEIDHNSTAWAWVQQALSDNPQNDRDLYAGNIRVLTLTDSQGHAAADVLVFMPLPSAAWMGAGLLGAIGVTGAVRRRRRFARA